MKKKSSQLTISNKVIIWGVIGTIAVLLLLPYLVESGTLNTIIDNPISCDEAGCLLNLILDWLLMIATPLAAGAIVWSGYQYMTSGGDKAKLQTAKNTLTYAIVGYVLILLAKSAGLIIKDMLNL